MIAAEAVGVRGAAVARSDVVSALTELLSDPMEGVRRAAAEAIGWLGLTDTPREIIIRLVRMLRDDDLSYTATEALGRLEWRSMGRILMRYFLTVLGGIKEDRRASIVFHISHYWIDLRLFQRGRYWTFATTGDLENGFQPFRDSAGRRITVTC